MCEAPSPAPCPLTLTAYAPTKTSTQVVRLALAAQGQDANAAACALLQPAMGASGASISPIFALATAPPDSPFRCVAGVTKELAQVLLTECGGAEGVMCEALYRALTEELDAVFAASAGGGGASPGGTRTPALARPPAALSCTICLDDKPAAECAVLSGCGHAFCAACLRSSAEAGRASGASVTLCPSAGCGSSLTHRELRALLGAAAFKRLDRAQMELACALDPTMHPCPTPDCPYICVWGSEEADGLPKLDCPMCHRSRCLVCKASPYHDGARCERAGGGGGGGGGSGAAEEAASESYLNDPSSGVKRCVKCTVPIAMTYGCFKMQCRCGYRFCWQCGIPNATCACTPSSHGYWGACICATPLSCACHLRPNLPSSPPPPTHTCAPLTQSDNKEGRADFSRR